MPSSPSGADVIKTPSPPNTIIYSGSLNSISSSVMSHQVMAANSRGEQSAMLFPSPESPLLDILSEAAEVQGMVGVVNSSPLAVPGYGCGGGSGGVSGGVSGGGGGGGGGRKGGGMEATHKTMDSGEWNFRYCSH